MAKFQIGFDDETGEGIFFNFPSKREVCSGCHGTGVTTAHVEADGGGFTSSEWRELDEEFRSDYMAGAYDRHCPDCEGRRVVDVIDYDRAERECPAELAARYAFVEEQWACWREDEAERRAGC